MSISNRSVDLTASTDDLELLLADYEGCYAELGEDEDGAYVEWIESAIELIEGELANREDTEQHDDSPSLQDSGYDLGSYAS